MEKSYETGIASEYLVLSNLFRLGADASISLGNKKAVDICIHRNDGQTIYIDVKSVRGTFSIPVNNILNSGDNFSKSGDNYYVVFVVYNNKFNDLTSVPDFYVVKRKEIAGRCYRAKDQARIHPKKHVPEYKDRWDLIVDNNKK